MFNKKFSLKITVNISNCEGLKRLAALYQSAYFSNWTRTDAFAVKCIFEITFDQTAAFKISSGDSNLLSQVKGCHGCPPK